MSDLGNKKTASGRCPSTVYLLYRIASIEKVPFLIGRSFLSGPLQPATQDSLGLFPVNISLPAFSWHLPFSGFYKIFSDSKKPANADVYGLFPAPRVGLEPTTTRLTAECSTIELSRNLWGLCPQNRILTAEPASPWLSLRPISMRQLCASLRLHPAPIYPVVSGGTPGRSLGGLISRGASRLDAFSAYPCRAWLPCHGIDSQQVHQRPVRPGPLVLRTAPLRYPAPAPDRDRTVSRRSEPSSRTALMGEQPNPWDLLQPQDAMSRHRGAKPLRRCELLGVISLLSPG